MTIEPEVPPRDRRAGETAGPTAQAERRFLYAVAFIEGGAVMVVEITGAKLVGPYYGGSLYVWAAVLGVTLGGLASGYFLGARLSRRPSVRATLFGILALSALLVVTMPWSAPWIMQATLGMDLRLGITLACLVFLLPPLVCFGTVSPMIIRLVAGPEAASGRASGTVYAVSTLGGIVLTLATAFWAIPELGMRVTLLLAAAALAVPPAVFYARAQGATECSEAP